VLSWNERQGAVASNMPIELQVGSTNGSKNKRSRAEPACSTSGVENLSKNRNLDQRKRDKEKQRISKFYSKENGKNPIKREERPDVDRESPQRTHPIRKLKEETGQKYD